MKKVKDIQPLYKMIAENPESLSALSTYNKDLNYAISKAQEEIIKKHLDEVQYVPYIQYCGEGLYKVSVSKDMIYYTCIEGARQAELKYKTTIQNMDCDNIYEVLDDEITKTESEIQQERDNK